MQALQANLTKPEIWILLNEIPSIDNSLLVILLHNAASYFIVESKITEKLLLATNKCIKIYLTSAEWEQILSGKDYSLIGNLDFSPIHFVDFISQ